MALRGLAAQEGSETMRKLKVYGGMYFTDNHKQMRHIMASTSWAKVAKATKYSVGYLRAYWCITGNESEIKLAMATPETLINTGRHY